MSLNRYEHERAMRLIDGYMVPSPAQPCENHVQQFDRAKAELVESLAKQLQQIEAFTYQDMLKKVS